MMLAKAGIKTKMLLFLCGVTIVIYAATIFFVMRSAGDMIKEEAFAKTRNLAASYSVITEKRTNLAMQTAKTIAQTVESFINEQTEVTQEELNAILHQITGANKEFLTAWVLLEPNTLFATPYYAWSCNEKGTVTSESYNDTATFTETSSEAFYTEAKKTQKEVVVEPYNDEDGVMITTTTYPIIVNGQFVGAAGIDISLAVVNELVSKINIYDGAGVAAVLSHSGTFIAHPDKDKINTKLQDSYNGDFAGEVLQAIEEGRELEQHYRSEVINDNTYAVFIPVYIGKTDTPWSFVAAVPEKKVLEKSKRILWLGLSFGTAAIVLTATAIWLIATSITKPLQQMIASLKDIAEGEGDLTRRIITTSQDELGELAFWFNTFIEKLQGIIGKIGGNTGEVKNASDELANIAADASSGAEKSAEQANTVAAATEELTTNLSTIAAAMEESTTNANMVASAAEEMNVTISQIAGNVSEASNISKDAVQQAENTSTRMEDLAKAAQAISKVTETISDISDKTNLLALNATIEAARAGEAGKGFVVVATEIKELANQTVEATNDIKNKIDGIQKTSQVSIDSIDNIVAIINKINDIVEIIDTAVKEQSAATEEISGSIAQTSQGLVEINENLSQGATIASEISGEIHKVSTGAADRAKSSEAISAEVSNLQTLAQNLGEIVNSFKIEENNGSL